MKRKRFYKRKFVIYLLCLLIILSGCGHRKTKIDRITNGYGVSVHFRGNPIDISQISSSGFNYVRTDMAWSIIETQKNKYDFKNTGYDSLTNNLIKHQITPYFILDYSNQLYEKKNSIVTEKGRRAFCKFVKLVTKRYRNKNIIWEIWNEPNVGFWNPQPSYTDYSLLVKEASKIIHQNDSSGIVVAPALAGTNHAAQNWLNEFFKRGVLKYIDAISVHPYRPTIPETVTTDYSEIRAIISKYTSKKIPIISGEWGYSTINGFTEQQQAEYITRMFLINQYNKIPISIWYDWKNDGLNSKNKENNFGLRANNVNQPKLAYFSVRTLMRNLKRYKYSKRINIGSNNDYVLEFTNKNNRRLVCWTTDTSHQIIFPKIIKGNIVSMYGENVGNINGSSIQVSPSPVYILLSKKSSSALK